MYFFFFSFIIWLLLKISESELQRINLKKNGKYTTAYIIFIKNVYDVGNIATYNFTYNNKKYYGTMGLNNVTKLSDTITVLFLEKDPSNNLSAYDVFIWNKKERKKYENEFKSD